MANRVLIDEEGLKVSRSGTNVLTAVDRDLQFNPQWSQITPFMKGSYVAYETNGTLIPFGKTFSRPPLVFFRWGETSRQFIGNSSMSVYEGIQNVYVNKWWLRVQTNGLYIRVGQSVSPMTIHYIVWDFML